MKRRRPNPDVPTPVLLLGAVAFGGALVYWLTRPAPNTVTLAVPQPLTDAQHMAMIGNGIPSLPDAVMADRERIAAMAGIGSAPGPDGACPPGLSAQWGSGRGGQRTCQPERFYVGERDTSELLPTPEQQREIDAWNAAHPAPIVGPGAQTLANLLTNMANADASRGALR